RPSSTRSRARCARHWASRWLPMATASTTARSIWARWRVTRRWSAPWSAPSRPMRPTNSSLPATRCPIRTDTCRSSSPDRRSCANSCSRNSTPFCIPSRSRPRRRFRRRTHPPRRKTRPPRRLQRRRLPHRQFRRPRSDARLVRPARYSSANRHRKDAPMDFSIPAHIKNLLADIDAFIEKEIVPLQAQDDNDRFFDHRREWARTDFEHGGLPRKEWEALLREMRKRADKAGFLRLALPEEFGGKNIGNLAMAIIREHLAAKGLGLHNDLQNESSVVGNFPQVLMMRDFGTPEQRKTILPGMLDGTMRLAFGLTEPKHGSDATWMETRAVKDGNGWRINGEKMWNTGVHVATHDMVFCRTSGNDGDARGLTCIIVPMSDPGVKIEEYMWTFNMPTDHARVSFKDVWVPDSAVFGPVDNGLVLARHFVHANRIRQAASGVGAAQYC